MTPNNELQHVPTPPDSHATPRSQQSVCGGSGGQQQDLDVLLGDGFHVRSPYRIHSGMTNN